MSYPHTSLQTQGTENLPGSLSFPQVLHFPPHKRHSWDATCPTPAQRLLLHSIVISIRVKEDRGANRKVQCQSACLEVTQHL